MSIEKTPSGYLKLIQQNRNFRFLWFGQIVSLLGDWFNLIASASLIASLSGSGLAIGGLFVIRMLAPFLISPFAGIMADRYNRKRLMILTDCLRAGVVLGFLLVRSEQHLWLLYALTALQLAISGIFFPTRNAILPDLVEEAELGAANALTSATWSVMAALGAALGGFVAGRWGIYQSFVVDAASFLLSATSLWQLRYTPLRSGDSGKSWLEAAVHQYVEGLRYLKNHLDTLALAMHKGATNLFAGGAFQVVQVVLSEQVFVIGEGGTISLGILYAVMGVGTGLGPIIGRRFTGDRDGPLRIAIALAYPLAAVGLLVTATLHSFPVVILGAFIRAVATGFVWVYSNQLLFTSAPQEIRGRIFATDFAFFTLASASSSALAGGVLDQMGLTLSGLLIWMGCLTLLPGLLWVWWLMRRRTREGNPHV
jgi:MFS family permease